MCNAFAFGWGDLEYFEGSDTGPDTRNDGSCGMERAHLNVHEISQRAPPKVVLEKSEVKGGVGGFTEGSKHDARAVLRLAAVTFGWWGDESHPQHPHRHLQDAKCAVQAGTSYPAQQWN